MPLHVEIVQNDWLGGYQTVVATVSIGSRGSFEIESPDPTRWEPVVHGALERVQGRTATAKLKALHEELHGTYLFATSAHASGSCPFHDRPYAPIESVPLNVHTPA